MRRVREVQVTEGWLTVGPAVVVVVEASASKVYPCERQHQSYCTVCQGLGI